MNNPSARQIAVLRLAKAALNPSSESYPNRPSEPNG